MVRRGTVGDFGEGASGFAGGVGVVAPRAGMRSKSVPGELLEGPGGVAAGAVCGFGATMVPEWGAGTFSFIFVEWSFEA